MLQERGGAKKRNVLFIKVPLTTLKIFPQNIPSKPEKQKKTIVLMNPFVGIQEQLILVVIFCSKVPIKRKESHSFSSLR